MELCAADAPREELFSALLRQVSAPDELHVLVVEDIHWADEATIDLLRFLGRRIRDGPGPAPGHLPGRGPDRHRPAPRSPWATWLPSGPSGASASRRSPRTRWRCWPTAAASILPRSTG